MPSADEIREFIRTIDETVSKHTYEEFSKLCTKYFPLNNPQNIPFPKVSKISYRPENEWEEIKSFGRVNKPKEAKFYG